MDQVPSTDSSLLSPFATGRAARPQLILTARHAQAMLMQSNQDGVSIHSHLTELIHQLLMEKGASALEDLENISLGVKAKRFVAAEAGERNPAPLPAATDDTWKKASNALFMVDTSEEDAGVPNLVEEASWFEWAGVGLPREEVMRLFHAMTALKRANSLKAVRFFGKILGTSADYYVVEGSYTPGSEPAAAAATAGTTPAEAPGTGLNTHVYFVAPNPSAPFVKLSDVLPEHVVSASGTKTFFTGSLGAPVKTFPAYPGNEAALLRAQIARIAAATVLAPAGKLAFDENVEAEPKPLKLADGFEGKSALEMVEADSWSHVCTGILKSGRATNPPVPEGAEAPEDTEEEVPALFSVSSDAPVAESIADVAGTGTPAWTFKRYCLQARDAGVVVARSHWWPGAYSAVVKGKHANLYVGYGYMATATPYTPAPPPPILSEAADVEDQPDVPLDAENEVLKAIDDARIAAEAEPAAGDEE